MSASQPRRFVHLLFCFALVLVAHLVPSSCDAQPPTPSGAVRFAQFNIQEMTTENLTDREPNGAGRNAQLQAAAAIIRKVNPDVLVINEIDHDLDAVTSGGDLSLNAIRFNDAYLNQGEQPLRYPFIYTAPCNTGILAGNDFDNNGKVATAADRGSRNHGGDSFGYGVYPGQYSMAVLSRFPLQHEQARTFQKFLWKDLPNNMIPGEWYSAEEIDIFRLSSKSHWDLPVTIGEKTVHLLVSHPTPPSFDGPENRNGRRNFDELRMWVHYLNNDSVMVDDRGVRGGLPKDAGFVIAGDLNAAPLGDKLHTGERSIDQLLNHPRVNDCGHLLTSQGALNGREPGPPKFIERHTAGWGNRSLRVDHLLPSQDLTAVGGGVFWPDSTTHAEDAALAGKASDHHMIWLDLEVK